eukprot:TRINITY_DN75888_c0_g1_i1.p1 TRINITY_DN75888_c0_g1~~TRINITY_DN75888_c0_g1_i1.p1  ORF type:complete len:406 (+),score=58.68 TRINITY_DN75888_c0_g1_i1:49-1266(+)
MVFAQLYLRWLRWSWERQQVCLRTRLLEHDDFAWSLDGESASRRLRFIAGVDISFFSNEQDPDDQRACSALVVYELDASNNLTVVWEDHEFIYMTEPYIAGFLAFREIPHLRSLLGRLRQARPEIMPDVILVDGNGVLHPKGFGCASHFGVVCNMVCIGVAKNLHVVDGLDRNDIRQRVETAGQGGHVLLTGASGRTWGAALLPDPPNKAALGRAAKEANAKNPIFVSVGHRISLETSLRVANLCCTSRREPEPTRAADMHSRELVRQAKSLRTVSDLVGAVNAEVTGLKKFEARGQKTLGCELGRISDAEVSGLKKALQDARSVMTDKELLKPANRLLQVLESTQPPDLAKLEALCSEALTRMAPALGPPQRIPRSGPSAAVVFCVAFGALGLGVVMARLRRRA